MPGGHGLLEGGATLLSSHAGRSPTGDERHSESQSGHTADSVKASQLAAGRNLSPRPDITGPIQTASVEAAAQLTKATQNDKRPGASRSRQAGSPDPAARPVRLAPTPRPRVGAARRRWSPGSRSLVTIASPLSPGRVQRSVS